MFAARHHRVFGVMTGWWATTVRILALVLALAVNLPASDLAEDMAFHGSRNRVELSASLDVAPNGIEAKDPGLVGHLHCSCHVLAILDAVAPAPIGQGSRPRYAQVSEAAPSLAPDRLPRPPRA